MITFIIGLVIGFVVGILVGHKNSASVEKAVTGAEIAIDKAKDAIKKKE